MASDQTYAGDEIPPGTEVIEVHVSELNQIFNSIDPSPFHEKDLDVDAEEFIVGWAKELPRDKPLALLVHLDKPSVTPEMARQLHEAVQAFFARRSAVAQQRLRDRLSAMAVRIVCPSGRTLSTSGEAPSPMPALVKTI